MAYDDLVENIIDKEFCIRCGACEAVCPVNAIKSDGDEPQRVYDCSKMLNLCSICYDVCPHSESLQTEATSFLREAPRVNPYMGHYMKILLAQTTDSKLAANKSGGAIIQSLLKYLMDNKEITGFVASETASTETMTSTAKIDVIPDDVLSSLDNKLFSAPIAKAFGQAISEHGKSSIAFVGLPCHVLALRKLQGWQHRFVDSLKITVGMFCLWNYSFPMLREYVHKKYGIETSAIKRLDLEDNLEVVTEGKRVLLPYEEAREHILNGCKTCQDFTAEFADISVGGALPLGDWSVVIIRTPRGDKLFSDLIESGLVRIANIEEHPETFSHLAEMTMHKRETAQAEIQRREMAGEPVPLSAGQPWASLPKEFIALASLRVGEVMTTNVVCVNEKTGIDDLLDIMVKNQHLGCPIVSDNDELVGVVTFEDIRRAGREKRKTMKAGDIGKRELLVDYPDEPVFKVFDKMNKFNVGRIIIVDRANPRKVLGILTRSDLTRALKPKG